ncbi:hypothetical protein PaeCFBP13512_02900 [Paenibacillus sp. CFBP13512]|uniref:AMP-binding protein n=1 Tax=Paenibacillus sp. CFBP13512 TaxID=2184007 RepID=UPI0010C0CD64|nr:AMP-binding protein [Paenibacillus sp. CFBP13512]TKJ93363.1 hypothetical protein PaeCFBP13512_02900 [Paenibacillus sp. CFBP13512]
MKNRWDDIQINLLEFMKHAAGQSPFYKERLKEISDTNWNQSVFEEIPILKKYEIIGKEESLLTNQMTKLYIEYTSGSTGQPLKCYKSHEEKWKKAKLLWGLRTKHREVGPKDLYAMFYAFNEEDLSTDSVAINNKVMYLSMLDMSPKRLDDYYEALLKYRPQWILSVSTALYLFANHILERKLDPSELPIKYIEINGEMLFEYQKETIEKVFGSIIYNHYGSREFWCIAMSCNYGNLHLATEQMYVEIIKPNKEGFGNVVITDLSNRVWPLIRYDTGDIGRLIGNKCKCGSVHPIIEITGGRSTQYIQSGNWISNPILFHYAVTKVNRLFPDAIRQFRVTQTDEKKFLFLLVPGIGLVEEAELLLKQELQSKLPHDMDITFIHQGKIEIEGPKFDYFIPYQSKR